MLPRAAVVVVIAVVASVSWLATCALWHFRNVAADIAPLEPRHFDRLTLITVGTGTAYENPHRLGPCTAVGLGDRLLLVDAGHGVAGALRAARLPVTQPEGILLTSLLPENLIGLDALLLTGWLEGRTRPLRLLGPPGTAAVAQAIEQAQAPGREALAEALGLPGEAAHFEVLEIADGWSEQRGGLTVRAAGLSGGPLAGRAYRFEGGGRSLVVGGAGWDAEALVALARDAQLLVHEAWHRPSVEMAIEAGTENPERLRREAALHAATTAVGALARSAGVETLILVRLRPPPLYEHQFRSLVGESYAGRVVVAEDAEEFTP